MIPEFDSRGNLPPGIHTAAWNEFKEKFGYNGHRKRLMGGMCEALKNLRHTGCSRAYTDGSFVTGKQRPNDYDGCWDTAGVEMDSLDPALKDFRPGRTVQKIRFAGELFPTDMSGNQTMLEFFQSDRDDNPKGTVQINLGDLDDKE